MQLVPWIGLTMASLATNGRSGKRKSYKTSLKIDHLMLKNIVAQDNSLVFIDVENVRGKSGFELDHDTLVERVSIWAKTYQLVGKVSLVVDHGSLPCGFWLEDQGLGVVFAGPDQKADDVIANDVPLFSRAVVVTSDMELQRRCRRNTQEEMHIMSPLKFLDDLEQTTANHKQLMALEADSSDDTVNHGTQPTDQSSDVLTLQEELELGKMDVEIKLGGQLLEAESILRTKKNITKKRRKKLEQRALNIRERLAVRGASVLGQVTSILSGDIEEDEQNLLLNRWKQIRRSSPRREETGDRIILAERLRRNIEDESTVSLDVLIDSDDTFTAITHANHMNGLVDSLALIQKAKPIPKRHLASVQSVSTGPVIHPTPIVNGVHHGVEEDSKSPQETELKTLTLTVVSDTHGYEQEFADAEGASSDVLPDADVLLHLGDFAIDGTSMQGRMALRSFDRWLAKQPHKHKIVIRGNHDPFKMNFMESGAQFIVKTQTVEIDGFVLALVPYASSRLMKTSGGLPSKCDVLATHVPPKSHLDKCLSGQKAGSAFLVQEVRRMKQDEQPKLWVCGHIHEGRGMMKRRFGKKRETTIINAANANHGRAQRLQYGPVVVEINSHDDKVKIVQMDDKSNTNFESSNAPKRIVQGGEDANSLMMAVDLGLKTGISLFNDKGQLIRYKQFQFKSREELEVSAPELIIQWENEANLDLDEGAKPWKITHVAIEGADVVLRESWSAATDGESNLLNVPPEEWRSSLLTIKERKSGVDAKAASRLIARQVVEDYGLTRHEGKFPTDVAESVVMGLYVARSLGWIKREPAIRRYTNDRVVVPKRVR